MKVLKTLSFGRGSNFFPLLHDPKLRFSLDLLHLKKKLDSFFLSLGKTMKSFENNKNRSQTTKEAQKPVIKLLSRRLMS